MIEIKTFIHNLTENYYDTQIRKSILNVSYGSVEDEEINSFLHTIGVHGKIINIQRQVALVHHHNNAGYESNVLITTISYEV